MNRALAFFPRHVLPALICCVVVWALARTTPFKRIESLSVDERTRFRARFETVTAADEIALLAVDERSLRDAGHWPWTRKVHGDLMQLLSRVRPAVVTWDVLFTEETPDDAAFAQALAMNRAAVLGAMQSHEDEDLKPDDAAAQGVRVEALGNVRGDQTQIPTAAAMLVPLGSLARAADIGFVDTPPDTDGVRRQAPLVVRVGDKVYPTLSLRTLMAYWGAEAKDIAVVLGEAVTINAPLARRVIPIDERGAYRINYRHGISGFAQYGYTSVLYDLTKRHEAGVSVPPRGLTGRIVLVGQTADGLADLGPTPFAPLTPLVLVHANVIENVLREDYVRSVPAWTVWLGCVVVCAYGLARFSDRRPPIQAVFAGLVPLAFVAGSLLAWLNWSYVVPMVGPLLAFTIVQTFMIGRRMVAELKQKEQIKGMFGTYVSPELVNRLVAAGQPPQLGGHEADITAFFSDIERFSGFSEILTPPQLVELMNEYLTACTDIVQAEGGTLDKYIGDAIVAMFGAPVVLPDHAYRACRATLAIQQRLAELRTQWRAEGRWPAIVGDLRTRIGLNSGPCVVGNMGSRTRFDYTMMGDNVNLAARMESGAKTWGTYAMCTEATHNGCVAQSADEIVFRLLGRIRVKGRASAVPVYEIAGRRTQLSADVLECFAAFDQGLQRYFEGDWHGAESMFRRSASLEPNRTPTGSGVTPSAVYLERLPQLRSMNPTNWDGVFVMTDK